ncbi:MAG TPA: phosphoribosyl-ATP diphosphatase [Rhodospirillales bacterium]|nr:phosphoribosyl-ATP diphosphatase [Rhodospirillales bacterium]
MAKKSIDSAVLERLFEKIKSHRKGDPKTSYSAKLFAKGRGKITQKLGEEAVETIIAALEGSSKEVAAESADMLYHLLALWVETGVKPGDVWSELARREGVSGLDEKKSRSKN